MFKYYRAAIGGAVGIPESKDWSDWVIPVPEWDGRVPALSDSFNPVKTKDKRQHLGVDFVLYPKPGEAPTPPMKHFWMGKNVPVLSAGPGKVIKAGKDSHGSYVILAHVVAGRSLVTIYRHMQFLMGGVYDGAVLPSAFPLGPIGDDPATAGNIPHLHFDMGWTSNYLAPRADWAIDSAPYMRNWKVVQMGGAGKPGKRIPVTVKTFGGSWPKETPAATKALAVTEDDSLTVTSPNQFKRFAFPLAGLFAGIAWFLLSYRKGNKR